MAFFYDQITGKSGLEQYGRYRDNEIYLRELRMDTDDVLNYQLIEIRRAITDRPDINQQSYEILTNKVCGTFELGFEKLTESIANIDLGLNAIASCLDDVNENIVNLHLMLDWKTDILIEELKINNFYLKDISKTLKIPDSEKKRVFHIENGIKFLLNAIEGGFKSEYYHDAYEEFLSAISQYNKDPFSLHKLGVISLESSAHLNIENAVDYFSKAAFYYKSEASIASKLEKPPVEISLTKEWFAEQRASAYYSLSKCFYIKGDFAESTSYSKQAVEIAPQNSQYRIQLAKSLAANNQDQDALGVLIEAIVIDENVFVKSLLDLDFISKDLIVDGLVAFSSKAILDVKEELDNLCDIIVSNSKMTGQVARLSKFMHNPTYLKCRYVKKELDKKENYSYEYNFIINNQMRSSLKIEFTNLKRILEAEKFEETHGLNLFNEIKANQSHRTLLEKKQKKIKIDIFLVQVKIYFFLLASLITLILTLRNNPSDLGNVQLILFSVFLYLLIGIARPLASKAYFSLGIFSIITFLIGSYMLFNYIGGGGFISFFWSAIPLKDFVTKLTAGVTVIAGTIYNLFSFKKMTAEKVNIMAALQRLSEFQG